MAGGAACHEQNVFCTKTICVSQVDISILYVIIIRENCFVEFLLLRVYAAIGLRSMSDRTIASSERFLSGIPQQKGIPLYEKNNQ